MTIYQFDVDEKSAMNFLKNVKGQDNSKVKIQITGKILQGEVIRNTKEQYKVNFSMKDAEVKVLE